MKIKIKNDYFLSWTGPKRSLSVAAFGWCLYKAVGHFLHVWPSVPIASLWPCFAEKRKTIVEK